MRKMCYLYPEDGVLVEADTLEDAIKQHPEVKQVVLFWAWERHYFTSNARIFEAYVMERNLDDEYSFYGDREDALAFAHGYGCWDGHTFAILNGDTLYGYNEELDTQTSWNDGYDHISGLHPGIDPQWIRAIVIHTDYTTGDR